MTEIQTGHHHGNRPESKRTYGDRRIERGNHAAEHGRSRSRAEHANRVDGYRSFDGDRHRADHARGARVYHRAALHEFSRRQPETFSYFESVATFTTDPTEAADAAQNLLATARTLLSQAIGAGTDPIEAGQALKASLAEARESAAVAATNADEAQGVEDTAALVEEGLENALAKSAEESPNFDDFVALQASRRQSYALRIRTQEGDVVKISLRSSEFVAISHNGEPIGEDAEGAPETEIALKTSTRASLRVFGDINEAELQAISSVFEQAADIAERFYNGDLAAALSASGELDFDSSQIAKIRLRFRSNTAVNALYTPPAIPQEPAQPTTQPEPAEASAPPELALPSAPGTPETDSTNETSVTQPENATESAAASIDTTDALVDAITAYFSSFIAGLEALQANDETSDENRYRLVTAFKLDVLKATLIASADEGSTDLAAHTAEVIEEAATSEAA